MSAGDTGNLERLARAAARTAPKPYREIVMIKPPAETPR